MVGARQWLAAAADLLAPACCAGCGEARQGVSALCSSCRLGQPSTVWPVDAPEGCRSAHFFVPYDHVLGAAWRRGKYRPDPWAVDAVVEGLEGSLGLLPGVDAVVPVPQDLRASWRRGFFPVGRLADGVAGELGVPRLDLLKRRGGPAQAGLERSERLESALRVYRARGERALDDVLLVDDVMTTGATATACATELLCTGVRRVHLLVICHAFA